MNRIADLTWNRPKLVLAAVGVFVLVAGAFGHDVEHHLKAAGFTDRASESEQAQRCSRDALGYDPTRGSSSSSAPTDGGPLDLKSPALRREVDRLRGKVGAGQVRRPRRQPAARIREPGRS